MDNNVTLHAAHMQNGRITSTEIHAIPANQNNIMRNIYKSEKFKGFHGKTIRATTMVVCYLEIVQKHPGLAEINAPIGPQEVMPL